MALPRGEVPGGAEIVVLAGEPAQEGRRYSRHTWLHLPPGGAQKLRTAEGCLFYVSQRWSSRARGGWLDVASGCDNPVAWRGALAYLAADTRVRGGRAESPLMSLSLNDYLSDAGISKWVEAAGVTNAPLPRSNLKTALSFFARHMPRLPPPMATNFVRAMDLSKRVNEVALPPGEPLIAFRVGNESPFKIFFGRPGGSKYGSGINYAGRSIVRFQVRATAIVLESYTSGTIDCWTVPEAAQHGTPYGRMNTYGVMVAGGERQLIIPNSFSCLSVVRA